MAKKALINPDEVISIEYASAWNQVNGEWVPTMNTITDALTIEEVYDAADVYEVGGTMYWVDCPDDCSDTKYYYKNNQFTVIPLVESPGAEHN